MGIAKKPRKTTKNPNPNYVPPGSARRRLMNIKVIIDDGVIRGVLKDCDIPVHVELIDTSDSYRDSAIEKHALSFLNNPNYLDCDYSVADFEE